jgi:hypothetical protein
LVYHNVPYLSPLRHRSESFSMCFSRFDIIATNAGDLSEPAAIGISFPVHFPILWDVNSWK